MHATFRFLAIVGAAVGIYLAAVLQSGPEQVDAHICALARRWHINVPTQCSPWVDTLAAPLIWLFLAGCIIFLTIDFLWPRLVKVPWKNHLRDVRVKAAEIVNPKHMIILGLTGTIVFAAIALAGVIWQSRKPTVGDPRSTALQAENSDLKQKLTVAERQAEQARQRPAAPLPRMPGDPPLPRNPYPDGPIFQRTFVGDDEIRTMISSIRELSNIAREMQNKIQIPDQLIKKRHIGLDTNAPRNFGEVIAKDGYDSATEKLKALTATAVLYSHQIQQIAARDPYFSADIYRVLGNTGLDELGNSAQGYVYGLQELKRINVPATKENSGFIMMTLGSAESLFEQAIANYRKWVNRFVSEREPQARALLTGSHQ